MSRTCLASSMVEARHDGRLGVRDGRAVARHVNVCPSCRALAHDLEQLSELGRCLVAGPVVSELHHRRVRTRLMRAAAGERIAAPPRRAWRVRAALVACAATCLVGLLAWALSTPTADRVTSDFARRALAGLSPPIEAEVDAAPTARFEWSRGVTTETVRLHDGAVNVGVHPLARGQRFLVTTTDAEVEVRGTRFSVRAAAGRLTEVVVYEGKVAVRTAAREHLLVAGTSWQRPSALALGAYAGGTASAAQPEALPSGRAPTAGRAAAQRPPPAGPAAAPVGGDAPSATPPAAVATMEGPAERAPPAAQPGRAAEFAKAVALIETGHFDQANAALRAFSRAHPNDVLAEDADFLAVVALSKAGRHAAAALAARDYLARYPNGARRTEAEAVAKRTK